MAFKVDDLIEFLNICDEALATEAVRISVDRLSESDMEELYGFTSEDLIKEVCELRHFRLPEDMREEDFDDEEIDEDEQDEPEEDVAEEDNVNEEYDIPQPKRHGGFFATLIAGFAGATAGFNDAQDRHNGRCNGDCAHCPPHYGYRYGRWYYGHDHTHGCEFGGNKGGGGL